MTGSGGFSTVSGAFVLLVLAKGVLNLGWLMTGASLWGERSWVGGLATATRDRDFEIAGVLIVGSTEIGD